jgi:hypothetical protein
MIFGPFNFGTQEGRFLALAYVVCIVGQGGYYLWTRNLDRKAGQALRRKR